MGSLKNFVYYLFLPILILGAIFFYGFGNEIVQKNVLSIKSGNNFLDFGTLQTNTPEIIRNLVLENISGEDLIIKKIYTDCDCLSVNFKLDKKNYKFSLPKDLNEKPINLFIPKNLDFSVQVVLRPNLISPGLFERFLFFEPESGKILKVKTLSNIRQ